MNLSKLAKLANVSVSTVSKAFANSNEISRTTKEMILQLAKETGCFEKYYKGIYDRKVIAVICPEIRSEYYASFVTYLEELITQKGGTMVLSVTNFKPKTEEELLHYYVNFGKADGVIILNAVTKIKNSEQLPVVAIAPANKQKDTDCIFIDSASAINDAVIHLKENGHTRIGFIGELHTSKKCNSFLAAMKGNSMQVNENYIVTSKDRFEEAGYYGMEQILQNETLPTAILSAYDYIAIGAIKKIGEHGMKVPDDISVIGMDNISVTSYFNIPLTSIKAHVSEICDVAVDLLLKKIQNKYFKINQDITVKNQLVIRNSVRKIESE